MTAPTAPVDMLASNALTWGRDTWKQPRLRESIARAYASFALAAPTEDERVKCLALAEKWGTP